MSVQKRQRGRRARWEVRWRQDGSQLSRTFDTKRDAEAFERDVRRRAQLGAHAPSEPSREALEAWLDRWWDRDEALWARSTRLSRASIIDKWVTPFIGGVRLRDLGPVRIREWRSEILRAKCSPKQANAAMRVLSAALTAATLDGLLPANPCAGIRRIPVDPVDRSALSADQAERIRAAVPSARDRALVGLLCYAGLRTEEALALRWSDLIGLSRIGGTISVERAWTAGEMRPTTKTGIARDVEIIAPLAEDLVALGDELDPDPEDFIAPSESGTPLDLSNWRARVWNEAAAAAGVTWATPYTGRRTYISLLIHAGTSPVLVAASVGHTSGETIWKHYARLFDRARKTPPVPMADAVRAARRRARRAKSVRPMCDGAEVIPLRAAGSRD